MPLPQPMPALIPPPRSVRAIEGDLGWCPVPGLFVVAADPALRRDALGLASELASLGLDAETVPVGTSPAHEVLSEAPVGSDGPGVPERVHVVLRLVAARPGECQAQAYELTVTEVGAVVEASTCAGVHLGTRTLLQLVAGALTDARTTGLAPRVPAVAIEDRPASEVRAFHLDVARKSFSLDWLKGQIREMSWIKLNELQLHLSEDEGFRLALRRHPEVVSPEHLSQDGLRELLALAERHRVRVVPALDVPGHMSQVLRSHPELRAGDSPAGRRILDYSRPEARALVIELIEEVAPLFPSNAWHLGGDEVFPLDSVTWSADEHERLAQDFPRLLEYAREHAAAGEAATVLDGYVAYLNTVVARLRELGKTDVRVWNDALGLPGVTERIHPDVTITYWTAWHEGFASVRDFVNDGHRLINFNDACFYDVLTTSGRAYGTPPDLSDVYKWAPGLYPRHRAAGAQDWRGEVPSWDRGASYSIWCDVPEVRTEDEVARRARPWRRVLASRAWNPDDSVPWERWRAVEAELPAPPTPRE